MLPVRLVRACKGGTAAQALRSKARWGAMAPFVSLPSVQPPRAPWRQLLGWPSQAWRPQGWASPRRRVVRPSILRSALHSDANTMKLEHQAYWRSVLQSVDKPSAVRLLDNVDLNYLTGLRPRREALEAAVAGPRARRGRKGVPIQHYYEAIKREHPTKVVLVRVGEFFEGVGIDAILMVQHAGLNVMGQGDPPRAGCPRANVRKTATDLVHAGLSVVICEEASEGYSYGYRRTNTKTRYVAQVLTPATPHLLYGLIDEDSDVTLDSTPPLLGISRQVGGFTVVEVNVELFKVTVTRGLTEDAVYARLYEGGLSPPLFIHVPGGACGQELSAAMAPWERRVSQAFRTQAGSVERYTGGDAVDGLIARVRQMLNLPAHAQFTTVTSSASDQPRPLYFSTATNLGLHSNRGIPSLLDALLPPSTPSAARAWMRALLMFPPPPRVGVAVLAACTQLRDLEVAVPVFPSLGVANLVLKLSQREANDIFFRELVGLCQSVGEACTSTGLAGLTESLLLAAAHTTGLLHSRAQLAQTCSDVIEKVGQVVEQEERVPGGSSDSEEDWEAGAAAVDATSRALGQLREANENKFRGRVQNSCIARQHEAVERTWQQVEADVRAMMAEVLSQAESQRAGAAASSAPGARPGSAASKAPVPSLVFNSVNNAVWVKAPKSGIPAKALQQLGLKHPYDRLGKTEAGYYSSKEVEGAQDAYRRACAEAAEAVKAQLKALAEGMQDQLPLLVTACTLSTVASALNAHMHEAARRGWVLPTQRFGSDFEPAEEQDEGGEGGEGIEDEIEDRIEDRIEIRGMWPYWLEGRSPEVVRNDVSMEGLFLLTGPNMAGKSTLLRTLCAVSLLGACGLSVPAARAELPYLDAFMLRNFSADSPVDGRSSFAVEMTEMRYVLADVTPRSLVLVDELGKGTEVRAGAALAGALLERLSDIGCKGVFATHLHVLLDMDLQLPGVRLMKMGVRSRPRQDENDELVGGLEPTWRMEPGSCRESLALEVARSCEVPLEVVQRAAELYAGMHAVTYDLPGGPAAQQVQQAQRRQQGEGGQKAGEAGLAAAHNGSRASLRNGSSPHDNGSSTTAIELRSLEEAGRLLLSTTAHSLAALLAQQHEAQHAQHALDDEGHGAAGLAASALLALPGGLKVQYVRPGQEPPPRTVGCACVYVVRRQDGNFYVGQTHSLRERIARHRARKPSCSSRVGGGPGIEVAYVALQGGVGGESTAKVVEAAAIRALQEAGFPLLSTRDSRRRHSPKFGPQGGGGVDG